ncbi:hypothetical protein M3Y96_00144000 [Aphelenchoides besseyi]|nr:hypothetical protein M3Y96_00144000 [Aphelenchoides besseyi]
MVYGMFFRIIAFILHFTYALNALIEHDEEKHFQNIRQLTFGGIHSNPVFSSDGRYLLFGAQDVVGKHRYGHLCKQLYYLDLEQPSQHPQLVSNKYGTYASAVFFPSGHSIAAASNVHNFEPVDLKSYDQTCSNPNNLPLFSSTVGENYDIYHMDMGKSYRPYRLTWNYPHISSVEMSMSRNGTIAYVEIDTNGNRKLLLMSGNGTAKRIPVAEEFDHIATPSFSLDGTQLAFYGHNGSSKNVVSPFGIHVVQMQNLSEITLVNSKRLSAIKTPTFHRNGQKIFVSASTVKQNETEQDIFLLDIFRVAPEQITFLGNNTFPLLSPNGTHFVWISSRNASATESNIFIANWIENPKLKSRKWYNDLLYMIWGEDKNK